VKTIDLKLRQDEAPVAERNPRVMEFAGHILRILAVLSALAVVALFAGFLLMLRVGHWLVKQDDLQKADAIAVLSGGFPARALEAASLYRDGYAKEIWLTKPGAGSPILKEMGIHYPTEADFNYRVLLRQGIPGKAIRILGQPIGNTSDEVDVISDKLQKRNENSVIIVTEKAHTRRVHMLWTRLSAPHGAAIIRAVSHDEFDPGAWWNHTEDTLQVVHEMVSLVNLWAGMPVHTRVHEQSSVAAKDPGVSLHSSGAHAPTADPVEQE